MVTCRSPGWLKLHWNKFLTPTGRLFPFRYRNRTHNEPLIGAHMFSQRASVTKLPGLVWSMEQVLEETYWQVLWSNQRSHCAASSHIEGWRRFYLVRTCAQKPSERAQTPWIGAICSTVEFCSSVSPGQACESNPPPTPLHLWSWRISERGVYFFSSKRKERLITFFWCWFLFLPRDDVFVCRKALLHDRVSGRKREPSNRWGSHPSDGFKLLQPDDRCLNEQLPGSADQVPLSDPGPGVPRDGEPPIPHRGSSPARRLPPTASALLRDATPRPAQLLPLGPTEQVFWTPISR